MIPKFRIFDKDKKQMVESAWWDFYFEDEGLLTVTSDLDVSYYADELGEVWELMQSTGLTDKNGKEIFEGDIVNIQFVVWDFEGETEKEYKNAAIYFDTYGSQLSVPSFYIKDEYGVRLLSELAFYDENIEIIGNIHEHPHLLEK